MEKYKLKTEKIPITVLVCAKNEEGNLGRCLESVSSFAEVVVIDSNSTDRTIEIAKKYGSKVVSYEWNGRYPKKRQWVIDTQKIGHEWVLWLDADEVLTLELIDELRHITNSNHRFSGFFISSGYIYDGKLLRYGMKNSKLALYDKSMVAFPEVGDLGFKGMGEIEGHYQPIKMQGYESRAIGQLKGQITHYAYEDSKAWLTRHERYAKWESQMIYNDAYPEDPVLWRETLKRFTRKCCLRPYLIFFYSYVFKLGFLDGKAGLSFALSRKNYCILVLNNLRSLKKNESET